MKILIAPDSFKGSLTSIEAAKIIGQAIRDFDPAIEIVEIPIADGGEGTVSAILWNKGGKMVSAHVHDPLGRKISASYGWIEEEKTAIIETAAASGLPLLKQSELDPELASSYGTGELIKDALGRGAETIILGLGGSATIDAGTGLFEALGVRFRDAEGQLVSMVGGALERIASMDISTLDPKIKQAKIIVASDVTNTLLGEAGAIPVFGPQKGVEKSQIARYERGMNHFAQIAAEAAGRQMWDAPGSGAAGGIGFLLQTILDVPFKSGLQLIVELSDMEKHMEDADLIITAEGRIDGQSLYGKVPVGIGRLAKQRHIPVIVFAGSIGEGTETLETEGIYAVMPIVDGPMQLSESMLNGGSLLYEAVLRFLKILQLGRTLRA